MSTAFSQAGGTFTAAGKALTLKAVTLSGGSFTASSGTTSIGGALKISGSPSSTPTAARSVSAARQSTLKCDGATFNLVTFANTKGTKTVGPDCSLPLGENPKAEAGGSIVVNGRWRAPER